MGVHINGVVFEISNSTCSLQVYIGKQFLFLKLFFPDIIEV